jgi:hypothetical protein
MEQQETTWGRVLELLSGFLGIGRVLVEALIIVAFTTLLTQWFPITFSQGLLVMLILYFFAQVRYLISEFQVYQNLRDFLDRVGDGPEYWDEYDDFEEEEELETPRRHLTPVYSFVEHNRRHDDNPDGDH